MIEEVTQHRLEERFQKGTIKEVKGWRKLIDNIKTTIEKLENEKPYRTTQQKTRKMESRNCKDKCQSRSGTIEQIVWSL